MPFNSFDDYPMSWKPQLDRSKRPLYKELAAALERDIAAGTLRPGTKLPPQRELADYLDLNLSTVAKAFRICSEKGLLKGTVGRGTYVAYDVTTRVATAAPQQPLIEMGVMMPERVSQKEINELLQEMLASQEMGRFFSYSIHADLWQLQAGASLLQRIGCPADAGHVCLSNGAQNALAAILCGLFQRGERIGVDPLIYPGFISCAREFGIQLIPIAQEKGEMCAEGIDYAVKNHGIKALYVMPDTQNPTCHVLSRKGRLMIAEKARQYGLLIIEDSMDRLLRMDQDLPMTIRSLIPEQTIYILSLSKAVNPALRLAYCAVPEPYFPALENALYTLNLSLSALLVELASRLIITSRLDAVIQQRISGLETRNTLTEEILGQWPLLGTHRSLARWLLLPENLSGIQFERIAAERGVAVYGSERFVVGKDAPPPAARISICSPDGRDSLRKGLEILAGILAEYRD